MFRHLVEDNIVSVEACPGFHWYALKDMVGEEWIAYGWLGPKSSVKSMVGLVSWETIDDLPNMSMSLDAPNGVQEYGD
jgi:hypothetical protein